MTVYTHRFMVVPAANVACAQGVAKTLANTQSVGSADGMWKTGCNATGTGTSTHYICAGMIDAGFASLLGNASATFQQYQLAGGTTYTLADITALYTAAPLGTYIRSDLNYEGGALKGLQDLGLKVIQGVL